MFKKFFLQDNFSYVTFFDDITFSEIILFEVNVYVK